MNNSFHIMGNIIYIKNFGVLSKLGLRFAVERKKYGDTSARFSYCRVPLGSALWLLLFLIYTADVDELVASLGFSSHFYAVVSQLYMWGPPSSYRLQRRRMELGV